MWKPATDAHQRRWLLERVHLAAGAARALRPALQRGVRHLHLLRPGKLLGPVPAVALALPLLALLLALARVRALALLRLLGRAQHRRRLLAPAEEEAPQALQRGALRLQLPRQEGQRLHRALQLLALLGRHTRAFDDGAQRREVDLHALALGDWWAGFHGRALEIMPTREMQSPGGSAAQRG